MYNKDLFSVKNLTTDLVNSIFIRTSEMAKLVNLKGGDDRLKGKILAELFYEPSSRTFSSFITAMQRLGGGIIPLNGMQNTSVSKGESFSHTVKVFSVYADCLVIRHPDSGKPEQAALFSDKPVINAGDGPNEHPSQALFDTYTIKERFFGLDKLTVTMVGDLKYGRTVHSLSLLLSKLDNSIQFNFISPEVLKMPKDIIESISKNGNRIVEDNNLDAVISNSDVIYMTRVQRERFSDLNEYEKLKSYFILDSTLMKKAKNEMVVMHPLPIAAGEISFDLDEDKRSFYLNQELRNGLYLRMALLDLILRKE